MPKPLAALRFLAKRAAVAGFLAMIAMLMVAVVALADPVGFTGTTFNCADGYADAFDFNLPTQSASHDAMVRITSLNTGGRYLGRQDYFRFSAGDVLWQPIGTVQAGTAPGLMVFCDSTSSGSFDVQLTDVPTTPTTYSGVTSPGDVSNLAFDIPAQAAYVADLNISQGSVTLDGGPSLRTFASSGSYDLGSLDPTNGTADVQVTANDGPPARWGISIHAVPLALSGLGFDRAVTRPGSIVTVSYTLTSAATVTASIVGAAGTTMRNLAEQLAVSKGQHSLKWDGLNAAGRPVLDGHYQVHLAGVDAAGGTASGTADIAIDGHGPIITLPPTLAHFPRLRGLAISVRDGVSGVTGATLSINGRTVAHLQPSTSVLTYRPAAGWSPGARYNISIAATDHVGNKTTLIRTLVAAGVSALPKLLGEATPHGRDTLLVRPAEISYTGDGTGFLGGFDGIAKRGNFGHLHWTSWTRQQGLAFSALWGNDCNPDCGQGKFSPVAAKVLASHPVNGTFTLLTISYTDHGKKIIDKRPLRHRPGFGWVYE